jgi:Na+/H+-dicarboxylate symporter
LYSERADSFGRDNDIEGRSALTESVHEQRALAAKGPSLSTMIFLSLGLGVLTGLFFGEMVAFLKVVGDVWIKLLQMTVLPYVMLSLVAGLGRLDYAHALLLLRKVGLMLLLLWAICLAIIFVFPLTFPPWESSSVSTCPPTCFTLWPMIWCPRWSCSALRSASP